MRDDFVIDVHSSPDQVSPDWPVGGAETAARCHAFQTVTFLKTWQPTYGATYGAELCLVEVRDAAGKPVLMLPLMITRQRGSRVLGFTDLGVSDYNAPVLFPTDVVWTRQSANELWQSIITRLPAFDLAMFDKMPEKVGDLANPFFLLSDELNDESCHLTNLDQPWAEVEKHVQGAKNLRNRFRALQRLGTCEVVVAETKEQRQFILESLLEQKQRRFEETNVPGFERHPEKRDFFSLGTETFAEIGALHLSALVVNGEAIAAMWGFTQGRHYYGLFFTFEAGEWTKYSPGRVLHHQLLQLLAERGFACLDLGIGDEPWKLAACDVTIPLHQFTAAYTLRGRMTLRLMQLHERLTQTALWQKLRPLKWILLRKFRPSKADANPVD
ncbi:GNAT family N-acetyltransferase [Devosia sp. 2618]|uniref:GNAT family N-acetyltransferase n=1 Tax=Devosia sp. 2618 TaxID=3156454 RepID=UPI00339B2656